MNKTKRHVEWMMLAVFLGWMPEWVGEAANKPLKVFILAGQSNMQGHANVSTLDFMADDPKTASILAEIRMTNGSPRVCEKVWISSVGCAGDGWSDVIEQTGKLTIGFGASPNEIGPELTFGIYAHEWLGEPILLIKTAWGGRSLITDFRPPGAGKRVMGDYILKRWKESGRDSEKEAASIEEKCGVFYQHMIAHVQKVLGNIQRVVPDYDPHQGYELAGFVWFQGFNDFVDDWSYHNRMKPGGYDEYTQLLAQFIRDVRHDLSAPKMPFVIGVMGIGGTAEEEKPPQSNFRQAQAAPAALPEFKGNVITVQTAPFWSGELGAIELKKEKVDLMRHLLNSKDKGQANAEGKMTEGQKEQYLKDYEAKLITPAETALWKRGASNGGYHYLGCAKTLALIGKAFAEALVTDNHTK